MAAMTGIRDLKKRSSELFRKCWAEAAFISLLQMGLFLLLYAVIMLLGIITGALQTGSILPKFNSFPPNFIIGSVILILIYYISTDPLMLGIRWYYWHAAEKNVMPVSSVFAGYRSTEYALSLIKLKVITDMRRLTPAIVSAACMAVTISITKKLLTYTLSDTGAFLIKVGCAVVCGGLILFFLISGMQYVPVGYLLADNPDAGADNIIKLSKKIVSKKYAYMMMLYASFIGWYVICIAGFPVLALIPYLNMTSAVFINDSIEQINSEITPESIENEQKQKENMPVG